MNARKATWLGLLCALVALAVVPAAASASGAPSNLLEAAAIGDPAATDPVADAPDTFFYRGEEISGEKAVALELSCNQGELAFECYDSTEELIRNTSGGTVAVARGGGVAAAAGGCAYNYLFEWGLPNKGGYVISFGGLNVWSNYADVYDKNTSSFNTGQANAVFAGWKNGGGNWFPESNPNCKYKATLVGTGWNDRFSSRRRF